MLIGDHNSFREGMTIHRAMTDDGPTTIGDHNYLMTNTHVGHDCRVSDHCTLTSAVLLAGHVVVDERVNIGGNAAVHQFCRVARSGQRHQHGQPCQPKGCSSLGGGAVV